MFRRLNRRNLVGGAAAFLCLSLAGCVQPLVQEDVQQALRVGSITVDASAIKPIGGGREITLTHSQIEADLKAALTAEMVRPGQGPGNADVLVRVDEIWLVSRGQSFAVGGTSAMTGTLSVRDSATGKIILAETRVGGVNRNLRLGGVLGVLTAPAPEKDYRDTLAGFARLTAERLLGKPAKAE